VPSCQRTLGVLALVQLPNVLPLLLVDDGQDTGDRLSDTVATKGKVLASQFPSLKYEVTKQVYIMVCGGIVWYKIVVVQQLV
jgi:hypothetical protein